MVLSSYRNTCESLGELGKNCGNTSRKESVSHSPKLALVFLHPDTNTVQVFYSSYNVWPWNDKIDVECLCKIHCKYNMKKTKTAVLMMCAFCDYVDLQANIHIK